MSHDVKDFETEVIERSNQIPVLVDFWAEWCGPCRVLTPVLERLAEKANGRWTLAKVNTEEHPELAARYGIHSIPNVKLFHQGKVVAEFVGALPEYAVRMWLQNNVPSIHAAEIAAARSLIESGRLPDARAKLEKIHDDEPENQEVRALLARAVVFEHPEKAAQLLEGVDDPRLSELTESLATLLHLADVRNNHTYLPDGSIKQRYLAAIEDVWNQRYESALEKFIDIIRDERYFDDDGSRKACIAIFKLLGEEHETTQKYRKEFSSALYV